MESMLRWLHVSPAPKGSNAAAFTDSVDKNVIEVLSEEKVHMEELLEFSFNRIDKLAERRGKTIARAKKLRLWEYVQRMRREQLCRVPTALPWEEVEVKHSPRSRSLSSGSLHCHMTFSGVGLATPPLYSLRQPLPPTSRGTATYKPPYQQKCDPNERFTLSEEWDSGSPHRSHVVSATRFKKKQRWQRLRDVLFHQKSKDPSKDESSGEFASFLAGVTYTSSPCSVS
ncbi:uncharacterized protein [Dermacentor albipictus]|uniref:uncharacterized protein isoform X2 n=1 Tax=Dermacentor albipictus TaxID=60249 RepID=UPI0038FC90EA